MPYVLGIDPGKDGGATLLAFTGEIVRQQAFGLSVKEGPYIDVVDVLRSVCLPNLDNAVEAFIENVHAMPGQGVSSTFTFGRNFGYVEMALYLLGVNMRLVHPATWTRTVHRAKGATAKERSVKTALLLWPEHDFRATPRHRVPHSGKVDSALIAEYGRRTLAAETKQGF